MTHSENPTGSLRVAIIDKLKETVGLRPDAIQRIVDEETRLFNKSVGVTVWSSLPPTDKIPIENPSAWLKVSDIVACFVDMEGSTKLSATLHQNSTAKAYRYFTQTATLIFHHFGASYIDIKGDGVFALFNPNQIHTALAATISFKTFVNRDFSPKIRTKTGLEIGGHYGIDQHTVLVRNLGLKAIGRTDRKNEVWAGKPINMAAKLAGLSTANTLWVSDRYHRNIKGDKALRSCGCPNGETAPLWTYQDVTDDERFDFNSAYSLSSNWCDKHGKGFCGEIAGYDN